MSQRGPVSDPTADSITADGEPARVDVDSTGETASDIEELGASSTEREGLTTAGANGCGGSETDDEHAVIDGTISGSVLTVEWCVRLADRIALVNVTVTNPSTVPREVGIENRLDGPTLPPRRAGVPAAGWDDARFEAVVDAGETLAVGYACPADASDPPVDVTDEPAPNAEPESNESVTAEAVIRRLDEHAPPRAVLPDSLPAHEEREDERTEESPAPAPTATSAETTAGDTEASGGERSEDGDAGLGPEHTEGEPGSANESATPDRTTTSDGDTLQPFDSDSSRGNATTDANQLLSLRTPPAVRAWLDDVERRLDAAERLGDADTRTATETLRVVGGAAGAAELETLVEADLVALRAFVDRGEELLERGEQVDVPVDALERLT